MIWGWRWIICIGIFILCCSNLSAQKYLVLDHYGKNRVRIPLGSELTFTLLGDKRKHRSRLVGLVDSVGIMGIMIYTLGWTISMLSIFIEIAGDHCVMARLFRRRDS
jgi:hypothetical protein